MLLLKSYSSMGCKSCSSVESIKLSIRTLYTSSTLTFSTKSDPLKIENSKNKKSSENKFLYNSVLYAKENKLGYFQKRKLLLKRSKKIGLIDPLPLSLKFVLNNTIPEKVEVPKDDLNENTRIVQFPYRSSSNVGEVSSSAENYEVQLSTPENIDKQIRSRHKELGNWMNAYDNLECDENYENNEINYGTPDPNSKISDVPCGGCGAFLHCKDTALPGYIPSEIFYNAYKPGAATLEAIICQRCFFLKEHDVALQVRVSAEDYPKVLMSLQNKKALILLMVDLTDFPCSIWPGISDILGPKTPIFVIGNKIDLIPKDSNKFIPIIKQKLIDHIKICGFGTSNILNVALISAKTGYGIEGLITSLHSLWKVKGDVYLIGCTNVGKSSLYNALLGSDYCKTQAKDLIQRATTSQWPGTTLNLLKFPILKPSAQRLYLRDLRLIKMNRQTFIEEERRNEQLRANNVAANATLLALVRDTRFQSLKFYLLPESLESKQSQSEVGNQKDQF